MREDTLTTAQLMLWSGQLLAPGSPQYNSAFTFSFQGPLDVDRLAGSFSRLVADCDNMRTVFRSRGGVVSQHVLDVAPRLLEVFRLAPRQKTELEAWITQRSAQAFDLTACCYDAVLLCLGPEEHILFLNQHHLIVDAWGVMVQYHRLRAYYQGGGDAGAGVLPDLPGFQDYRRSLEIQQAAELPPYWSNAAPPAPPRLLGRDNPTGVSDSPRVVVELPPRFPEALRRLAGHPRVKHWNWNMTVFNVLSALLAAYCHRLTGDTQLAIGTPAANRASKTEQELPGMVVEMLPLYATVKKEDSFLDLIERQKNSLNGFLRAARPGVIQPALAAGYNVVLNYITADFGPLSPAVACDTVWHSPGHADPGHHLRLQVHNFNGKVIPALELDLNAAVFTPEDRKRIPAQFSRLVTACLADPAQRIAAVDLLDNETKSELAGRARGEQRAIPQGTVLEQFVRQARQRPEAIAIAGPAGKVTYAELEEQAGQLAAFLNHRIKGPGQVILLFLPRCADLLVAILGCWRAGHTYVPLPAGTPQGRIDHIVEETRAGMIITDTARSRQVTQQGVAVLLMDEDRHLLQRHVSNSLPSCQGDAPAYIMYTSGSSGQPKGVVIGQAALANYIDHARRTYVTTPAPVFPLFTAIGFDLTVTSLFTPLVCGGRIEVYPEPPPGTPDLAVLQVMQDDRCDVVKLTPSHLALLRGRDYRSGRLRTLIVGGEQLTTGLALEASKMLPPEAAIFNEYGPTEATVGCIVHHYTGESGGDQPAVPIGRPMANTEAWLLDDSGQPVVPGATGELYLGGAGLAEGYWVRPELTQARFVDHPFSPGERLYRSGDRARHNATGELEFLGRRDRQTKWRGYRIELDEIEHHLAAHPAVGAAAVELVDPTSGGELPINHYCTRCGLPANYPSASFDQEGVCQLCRGFTAYEARARSYFRTRDDLLRIFREQPRDAAAEYDCIMLLSGGKDSTYALAQLVDMGLRVLAFTLDNGYISEQALDNINRVTRALGVDVHVGSTPAMNEIFVDSLQRHCNVCNGCFKTIYTLSTQLALEKNIPFIVTGLSRGQFFETRLTEELFWSEENTDRSIDEAILEARKVYHRADDAVSRLLDTSAFADDEVFERVSFLDFYRYTDATLEEMYDYLDRRLPWVRPTDTGRSTNCLINQVGIYVHKQEKGYNNYAFPYSWDVRIGHKDREAALEEINEEVDETAVRRIMREIGYHNGADAYDRRQLVAYYTTSADLSPQDLRAHLQASLPDYCIPQRFLPLPEMPLTSSGKVDRRALTERGRRGDASSTADYAPPEGEIEELLAAIWTEVLTRDRIGRHDQFLELGGHSLTAIRLAARISDAFQFEVPLHRVFELPTIALQAAFLEETLVRLLANTDNH